MDEGVNRWISPMYYIKKIVSHEELNLTARFTISLLALHNMHDHEQKRWTVPCVLHNVRRLGFKERGQDK